MIRYGLFKDFQGSRKTLLIWGDRHFDQLKELFGKLAVNELQTICFSEFPWLLAVGPCSVIINRTDAKKGTIKLSDDETHTVVQCVIPKEVLSIFAELIDPLSEDKCVDGHQYLDITAVSPIQIIVSKGEYPETLSPTSNNANY